MASLKLRVEPGLLKKWQTLLVSLLLLTLTLAVLWTIRLNGHREALPLDPETVAAHNNLASLLIRRGQLEEGLAEAQTALRLQPNFPQAHVQAGHALFLQDKFTEAEAHYRLAIKLKPDLTVAYVALGTTLANEGNLQEAIAPLTEASRLVPNDPEPHQIMARIYAGGKRAEAASHEYAAALRLDPDWLEGMTALAGILATHPEPKLRDGAQAVQLAVRASVLTGSTNMAVQATLAAAYAEAGMFPQAVELQEMLWNLARAQNQLTEAASAKDRLELYRAGKPCREP